MMTSLSSNTDSIVLLHSTDSLRRLATIGTGVISRCDGGESRSLHCSSYVHDSNLEIVGPLSLHLFLPGPHQLSTDISIHFFHQLCAANWINVASQGWFQDLPPARTHGTWYFCLNRVPSGHAIWHAIQQKIEVDSVCKRSSCWKCEASRAACVLVKGCLFTCYAKGSDTCKRGKN